MTDVYPAPRDSLEPSPRVLESSSLSGTSRSARTLTSAMMDEMEAAFQIQNASTPRFLFIFYYYFLKNIVNINNNNNNSIQGSFRCGSCRIGFVGNQTVGCRPAHNICPDRITVCDENADCICIAVNQYTCQVNTKYLYIFFILKKIIIIT